VAEKARPTTLSGVLTSLGVTHAVVLSRTIEVEFRLFGTLRTALYVSRDFSDVDASP
jgi:hypothetical protein